MIKARKRAKTRIKNKLPYKGKEKNLANLYLINLEHSLNQKEEEEERFKFGKRRGMRIIYTYNILNLSEKEGKNEDRKQTSV